MDVCSTREYDNFDGIGSRPVDDRFGNNYALVGGGHEIRRYLWVFFDRMWGGEETECWCGGGISVMGCCGWQVIL